MNKSLYTQYKMVLLAYTLGLKAAARPSERDDGLSCIQIKSKRKILK